MQEENKFEYTTVYDEFKGIVETLLSDFLDEIGVTNEDFVCAVGSSAHENRLSTFVLSSILTVDDFLQFKAMMVKRNMDLTNEVLEANIKEAPKAQGAPGHGTAEACPVTAASETGPSVLVRLSLDSSLS